VFFEIENVFNNRKNAFKLYFENMAGNKSTRKMKAILR